MILATTGYLMARRKNPDLVGTLFGVAVIGAAGWAAYEIFKPREAKAKKKKTPSAPKAPTEPDQDTILIPQPPTPTGIVDPLVRLQAQPGPMVLGRPTVLLDTPVEDWRVVPGIDVPGLDPSDAFVFSESFPVDVLVSVPSDFFPPTLVQAAVGNELVAGTQGQDRDFVFRIRQPAVSLEDESPTVMDAALQTHRDNYSAIVNAVFNQGGSQWNVPMRIYVIG